MPRVTEVHVNGCEDAEPVAACVRALETLKATHGEAVVSAMVAVAAGQLAHHLGSRAAQRTLYTIIGALPGDGRHS